MGLPASAESLCAVCTVWTHREKVAVCEPGVELSAGKALDGHRDLGLPAS